MINSKDWKTLPYGSYMCRDGSAVIFDRRYNPLVRMRALATGIAAHDRASNFIAEFPRTVVEPCVFGERIEFDRQCWFYDRALPDSRPGVLNQILWFIDRFPELGAEIERRQAGKK